MISLYRRYALFAAVLALPLGLAACGVKGPLEPPPGVTLTDAERAAEAEDERRRSEAVRRDEAVPGYSRVQTSEAPPVYRQAPAAGQSSVLDWFIR